MADVRIKYKVDKGELVLAREELEKIEKEIGVTENKSKGLSKNFAVLGGAIAAAFTVDKLIDFGKQVVSITAEFQKFRAVLTNTLGSQSAADQALKRIQDFASKTPFQVNQLTASFVKLANQGFVPTTKELRKLGDLASSTGKDFDQLTEAIIDAQVGEFERLKEFGIRANKQGDEVKFTFKGVETQVRFTETAIRDYLLSLGDTEGVSGSMAAISETLGGKLSNLQDNFDQLKINIGELVAGPLSSFIDVLNTYLSNADPVLEALENQTRSVKDLREESELLSKQLPFAGFNAANIQSQILAIEEAIAKFTAYRIVAGSAEEGVGELDTGLAALTQTLADIDKKTENVTKKTEGLSKATREVYDEEISLSEALSEVQLVLESSRDDRLDIIDEITEANQEALNQELEDQKEVNLEKIKNEEETAAAIKELRKQLFFEASNAVFEIERGFTERRIQKLEEEKERRIAIAGEDADQKAKIEEEFNRKIAEQKRKQAISEKLQAIFNIGVNTAEAIVKSVAASPVTFGQPFAGVAAAIGAVQLAAVLSKPVPKFAKGVLDLNGPGSGTSDSIHAMLSKGESVMTARETRDFLPTLRAIRENRIDPKLLNSIAQRGPQVIHAVNEVPRDVINIDENGFSKFLVTRQQKSQVLMSKYRT